MKKKNFIRTILIILCFLMILFTDRIYSEDIPVFKNAVLTQIPLKRVFNGIRMMDTSYRVYKDKGVNLNVIKDFFQKEYKKRKYTLQNSDQNHFGKSKYIGLSYVNKKNLVKVLIEDRLDQDIITINISVMDKKVLYDFDTIGINKKRDNPGFDIKGIPRCPNTLRVFSIKIEEEKKILQQVIYKSVSDVYALTRFYLSDMERCGWTFSRKMKQKNTVMLFFKKNERACNIMITYNSMINKNTITIQESRKL